MSDEPVSEPSGVRVTSGAIYALLLSTKEAVDALGIKREGDEKRIDDHEERIRDIEARENLAARVAGLEKSVEALKVRVYAIPGAGVVIAGIAVVVALLKS